MNDTSIIMDIGGGSVEFIICNKEVLLKESFEIGAQRLYDQFCKQTNVIDMKLYLKMYCNDYLHYGKQ